MNKETLLTPENGLPLSSYSDFGAAFEKDETFFNSYYSSKDSDNLDQYLILYHEESGELYSSKIFEKPPAPHSSGNLATRHTETKMCVCFSRWLILLLHAASGVVSLVCCVYSLVGTLFRHQCLPNLVDNNGTRVRYTHGFSAMCDTAVIGLGVMAGLNFLSVIAVNWYIKKPSLVLLSLLLAVIMAAFAIFGASIFTAHFVLWCDSISQAQSGHKTDDCLSAAKIFDVNHESANMEAFHSEMQIQQVLLWTLFPIAAVTIIAYSLVLRFRSPDNDETSVDGGGAPSGYFRFLATSLARERVGNEYTINSADDERTPFLNS